MHLKSIILSCLPILITSCRDANTEVKSSQVESPPAKEAAQFFDPNLSDSLKPGMSIQEARELLRSVDVKQKRLKNDELMRVYFFPEQENSGDLVAIDLYLDGDLVTKCHFGYRK